MAEEKVVLVVLDKEAVRSAKKQKLSKRYDIMITAIKQILSDLDLDIDVATTAQYSGIKYEEQIFRKFHTVRFINGPSNRPLGRNILTKLGIPEVEAKLDFFADGSPLIEIKENIRETDIFILQSGTNDADHSINDYMEQLKGIVDACKRSGANSITIIAPFYPYARSDKRDAPRVPIMAKTITTQFEVTGADRIIAVDLHSGQIQGFADKPFDNLYSKVLFVNYLKQNFFAGKTQEQINKEYVLVSPDAGGEKRVHAYAESLGMNNVTMHKTRDYTTPNKVLKSILIGEKSSVEGRICFVVDDMIDTAGTLISSIDILMQSKAKEVIPVMTHGVLSGPAIERINNCPYINQLILTNTLPQEANIAKCTKKIHVVDVGDLIAYTIACLRFGGSISELFKHIP